MVICLCLSDIFKNDLNYGQVSNCIFLVNVHLSFRSEDSVYKCTSFKMNTQISTLFPSLKLFSLQIFKKNIDQDRV